VTASLEVFMDTDWRRFQNLLDAHHEWPCEYLFKFIVPEDKKQDVLNLFESKDLISSRKSSKGRYVSISATCTVNCSEEILVIYQAAARIQGVISL
jgi:putative lipoic acid-binding regulatory protein